MKDLVLGGKAYNIRPLTIGQLRTILPAVSRTGSADGSAIDSTLSIIHAALMRDHTMSFADLCEIESTPAEIAKACNEVLKLAGLVPAGEAVAETP